MANNLAKCCCYCNALIIAHIIGTLFSIAPFVFAVLSIGRDRPAFYLNDLHVSLLNKTLTNTTTTMIHFNLTIKNPNILYGLYYKDPLNLTFTYFPPSINKTNNVTIGRYNIQGFYQGFRKVKHVRDFVVVQDIFSVAKQLKEPAKVALLLVDLDARVKFKSIEHKKFHLVSRVFVEVNCNTGNVVQNKTDFQMRYTSGSDKWKFIQW
uniref:protein NDR1-like n=1 Tax=Erigeron canadensis TaxID=72917 RepID=UPI001CB8BC5C|nr:protein NDR1-like [Erigeron canadensis]